MALSDCGMRLILISAWNDSGGGFLHRLIDGHSQLAAWPFELQLGNGGRLDAFSRLIGDKYRWPIVRHPADEFFDSVTDDELKSVLAQPSRAKHRAFPLAIDPGAWRLEFLRRAGAGTRRDLIAAYIDSFLLQARPAANAAGLVAHCPNIVIDAGEILADFPDARLLHVVRNPLAGIVDFRRRHPDFPVAAYAARWSAVNGAAVRAQQDYPSSLLLIDFADLVTNRMEAMRRVIGFLQLPFEDVLLRPGWNGRDLDESDMGPFGGVPAIDPTREERLPAMLSEDEREALLQATADARDMAAAAFRAQKHDRY